MKLRSLLCLAPLCLLLTACPNFVNAPGAAFVASPANPAKATVYFYRPAQKIMSDYPFCMSLPESANNCFRLESGGYTTYVGDPGTVKFAGMMLTYRTLTLDLKAGDERYVEVKIEDDNADWAEVPAAEAKPKLAETRGIEHCSNDMIKKP